MEKVPDALRIGTFFVANNEKATDALWSPSEVSDGHRGKQNL